MSAVCRSAWRALFFCVGSVACQKEDADVLGRAANDLHADTHASSAARTQRWALLAVQVTELRPGGRPWDDGDPAGAGKPDIAVCIRADGKHRCYPGVSRISGPACADSFDCDIDVEVPARGEFDVEVWDADESVHDLISKGQCSFGERCHFGACTVVTSAITP